MHLLQLFRIIKELAVVDTRYNSLLHRYDSLSEIHTRLSVSSNQSLGESASESSEANMSLQTLQQQLDAVCAEKIHLRTNLKNAEREQSDLLDSIQKLMKEKQTIEINFEDTKIKYNNLKKAHDDLQVKFHDATESSKLIEDLYQDTLKERNALKDSLKLFSNDEMQLDSKSQTMSDDYL